MANDKFDFSVAAQLVQAVEMAVSEIDAKNGQLEKSFGNLHEYFKDEGYEEYASDMGAASRTIGEIIQQLHEISKSIASYADRLQNEVQV